MFPVNMIYQPTEQDKPITVSVYNFETTDDSEGTPTTVFVTAWENNSKRWLIAPIGCFQPKQKKTLKEG